MSEFSLKNISLALNSVALFSFPLSQFRGNYNNTYTYHSRFIPEEVAEASQIFLRDTHVLPKLVSLRNTADVTGGKPIAVLLQSISGVSAINP
jgi:hypothetical protein